MLRKAPSPHDAKVLVTFELPACLWASRIFLVGDFNGWDPVAHELHQRASDGVWTITLELDAGSAYEFRYLIDDTTWCNDDHADSYILHPYGGDNSVVVAAIEEQS